MLFLAARKLALGATISVLKIREQDEKCRAGPRPEGSGEVDFGIGFTGRSVWRG